MSASPSESAAPCACALVFGGRLVGTNNFYGGKRSRTKRQCEPSQRESDRRRQDSQGAAFHRRMGVHADARGRSVRRVMAALPQ